MGVPEIVPLAVFKLSPVGSAGLTVYVHHEQLLVKVRDMDVLSCEVTVVEAWVNAGMTLMFTSWT